MSEYGPGSGKRYRCTGCGNLTRFDIESVEHVRRFWHADLSGRGRVESEERLATHSETVTCQWCGPAGTIEVIDAPAAATVGRSDQGDR